MVNKQNLAEALRLALRQRKEKQAEFALSQHIDPDDFRIQLSRNAFSQQTIEAAASILVNGSVADLEEKYEYKFLNKRMDESILPAQAMREKINRLFKAPPRDFLEDVLALYSTLDGDDLVIICSISESPLECTFEGWEALKDVFISAIENKAVFVYIRPSESYLSEISESLLEFFPRNSPRKEIEILHEKLSRAGVSSDLIKNVKLFETESCPFWSVGLRFGLYSVKQENSKNRDVTLFVRFPFGGIISSEGKPAENILLFVNEKMRNAFLAYLTDTFGQDENFSPLLARLRKSR